MQSNAIGIASLTVEYKKGLFRKTGRGVSKLTFSVGRGELFGFLGPNGAGKTTTIKVLTGLLKPTAGSVSILGGSITERDTRRLIGYMPENPYFYEYLTAHETLIFYGELFSLKKEEIHSRSEKLLDLVGLKNVDGVRIGEYSKGMRQRLGFAQALINDPEVIILDEPLSGLDPLGRADLKECMRNFHQQGKTVFFSSHILPDVEDTCTQIGLIDRGTLIESGPIGSILEKTGTNIEIVVRSETDLSAVVTKGEILKSSRDIYRIRTGSENTSSILLEELGDKNIEIISVTPVRQDLESFFIKRIQQNKDI